MGKIHGVRWVVPRQVHSRFLRLGIVRVVGILAIIWLIHQQHLYSIYRSALSAKYAPTDFGDTDFETTYQMDDEAALLKDELIANREGWKKLGAGWEGTTYTYNGVVIKTFTPGRRPFRNCAPRNTSSRWPTEIPASTLLGNNATGRSNASSKSKDTLQGRFLPVRTAFYATTDPDALLEWHLVTPFAPQGIGLRALDARYRGKFHDLLDSLQALYEAGFCHDDIKLDNVFLRDCRANDSIRALKSYILFLRSASADADLLDKKLFLRQAPLSRLFWWTMDGAQTMTSDELRRQSRIEHAERTAGVKAGTREIEFMEQPSHLPRLPFRDIRLSKKTERMLDLHNSEVYARWMAMGWIFGIEQDACP
ncbi:hypothetical protein BU23DRAFT_583653 [Bimuria novae-zelandiae CBS 107.79]|uniref:Protein kinase domain-containing protein n=1 Tax=Bimuria novae-zelandiae CBS 107.79 TaxID=1447943 RepID=A0A6A5UXY5_9PLEO|nr:hypothetical protein BU23DRAFT_583653 [Bimuria novae-zelandiae CBS 107.79]